MSPLERFSHALMSLAESPRYTLGQPVAYVGKRYLSSLNAALASNPSVVFQAETRPYRRAGQDTADNCRGMLLGVAIYERGEGDTLEMVVE